MLYIYLDESYNLKDRNKKQFISINGFLTLKGRELFKEWKQCRSAFVGKRRIHATDRTFNDLRINALQIIKRNDLTVLTVFQALQEIPFQKEKAYFKKGKLNFEKVYLDLVKGLFKELQLGEYQRIKIIIDSRKHKLGILGKRKFAEEILYFLRSKHPKTISEFKPQPSTTDILLELADFISNMFYRAYMKDDKEFFEELRFKTEQTKNPL